MLNDLTVNQQQIINEFNDAVEQKGEEYESDQASKKHGSNGSGEYEEASSNRLKNIHHEDYKPKIEQYSKQVMRMLQVKQVPFDTNQLHLYFND